MLHDFLKNITREEITLLVAVIGVIGVFVGACVTGLTAILAPWLLRRSEEKRHFRQLAVTSGLDLWRTACDIQLEAAKLTGKEQTIGPADPFIAHMLRIVEIATDMKLSSTEAAEAIQKLPLPNAKAIPKKA
jgi:hypothetical protein